jgi:hypothetical protein
LGGELTCTRAEQYAGANGEAPALTHFQKLPNAALKV